MDQARRNQIQVLLKNHIFNIESVSEDALELYDQALTHRSYANEMRDKKIDCVDNERLEFLGNFVLGLVVSEYLYIEFDYSEGEMTKRMEIVSDAKLAEMIRKKDIGLDNRGIRLGKRTFKASNELEDSILAGSFEAFIGAIYLDQGIPKARKITLGLLSEDINDFDPKSNFIGRLQEFVQKHKMGELKYVEKKITGPDHRPTFLAIVKIAKKNYGEGTGSSKKAAKMVAAKSALKKIGATKK